MQGNRQPSRDSKRLQLLSVRTTLPVLRSALWNNPGLRDPNPKDRVNLVVAQARQGTIWGPEIEREPLLGIFGALGGVRELKTA